VGVATLLGGHVVHGAHDLPGAGELLAVVMRPGEECETHVEDFDSWSVVSCQWSVVKRISRGALVPTTNH
jgi:hypothetical protein